MSHLSPAKLDAKDDNLTLCTKTGLTGCPDDFDRLNLVGVSNVPSNVQKGGKLKRKTRKGRRRRQRGGNYGYQLTKQNEAIIHGRDGTYVPTVGSTNCTPNYVLDKANLNASDPNEPFPVSGKYSSVAAAPIPTNEVNNYESNYNMKGGYSKDLTGYKYPGPGMSKNAGVPEPKGNPLLEAGPSENTVDVAQYAGVAKDQNKLFYGSYAPVTQVKRGGAKKSRKGRKSKKGRKSRKVHKKHQKSKKHRKQQKKSRKSKKHRKRQRGGAGVKPLSPHGFETSPVDPSKIVKTAPSWSNVPSSPSYGMADNSMVPSESWLGSQPMPIKQQNQNGTGNCVDNYNHFKAGTKKV